MKTAISAAGIPELNQQILVKHLNPIRDMQVVLDPTLTQISLLQ